MGLATVELDINYQTSTTRDEFCRAAVNFLRKYGYDVDSVTPKSFSDTTDKDIGIAAALGITSGTDTAKNLFSPDGTLTREQAATMLHNVMNVICKTAPTSGVVWTDAKDISSWAKEASDIMYSAKIMGGTSTTELVFSPKTPYTHEQSIITLVNLWEYVK
jgi:ABC-type antimicrobial peptide transport system ATPase subunit